jgi:hypothetical protein
MSNDPQRQEECLKGTAPPPTSIDSHWPAHAVRPRNEKAIEGSGTDPE